MKLRELAKDYGLVSDDLERVAYQDERIKVSGMANNVIADKDAPLTLLAYFEARWDTDRITPNLEAFISENFPSEYAVVRGKREARAGERELQSRQKAEEKQQLTEKVGKRYRGILPGSVYHIEGSRGRVLDVFPNKCVISVDVTAGAILTGNATDGEKTIWYGDCIGLQYKHRGLTLGYLQLETACNSMNNAKSNFFNENTFTFGDSSDISSEEMDIVVEYIKERMEVIKLRQYGSGLE